MSVQMYSKSLRAENSRSQKLILEFRVSENPRSRKTTNIGPQKNSMRNKGEKVMIGKSKAHGEKQSEDQLKPVNKNLGIIFERFGQRIVESPQSQFVFQL